MAETNAEIPTPAEFARARHVEGVGSPVMVFSASPITLSAPERGEDLQLRVSAPITGSDLPIIVFCHGFGSSSDAYAPLVNFWAARGFVVLQPTFLDSRRLGLSDDDPRKPDIWRVRIADVKRVLEDLDAVENAVTWLRGRLDRSRIAAVGHSFGAQTVGQLLGARTVSADGQLGDDHTDSRISAGVLLSAGGRGGDALSLLAATHLPYLDQSYANMRTPTLVVAGDNDRSPLTVLGPEWFEDAFFLSPGADQLVTLYSGEHMLGGISGYLVSETSDECPLRVSAVQMLTWGYLQSALHTNDGAWRAAVSEFQSQRSPQGRVQTKSKSIAA